MKFTTAPFFRQRGDCCVFIEVVHVTSYTNEGSNLLVNWCRKIDSTGWKVIHQEHIRVRAKDYYEWSPYHPPGEKVNAS